jgi:hypothetical protein
MAWEVLNEKVPKRGGPPRAYFLRVSVQKHNIVSIVVSAALLKAMRWQVGDHVNVLIDRETSRIGLQRTTATSGRMITADWTKKKKPGFGTVRMRVNDPEIRALMAWESEPRLLDITECTQGDNLVTFAMLAQEAT